MTILRTNGERFLAAAARFFFLGVWLPSAFLLGDLPLVDLGISRHDEGPLAIMTAAMGWGVVTSFLAVAGIATEGNAWFRARQRPVLTWLARPAVRAAVLAGAIATMGALLAAGLTKQMELEALAFTAIAALVYLRSTRETQKRDAPLAPRVEMYAVDAFAHRAPYISLALMMLTVPLLAFSPSASTVLAVLAISGLFVLTAWRARAPIAEVGSDGLYIRTLRSRFVPFRRGDSITVHDWGLEVRRGETRLARLRYRNADFDRKGAIANQVCAIVDALADAPPMNEDEPPSAYRRAAATRDALWRIALAPELSPKIRIDAAVQLQHDAEKGDDERLEVAVDSTADPKTRAILRDALLADRSK